MDNVSEFLKGQPGNAPHGHPDHVCTPWPALAVVFIPNEDGQVEVHLHGIDVPKERATQLLHLAALVWGSGGMVNAVTGVKAIPGDLTDDQR